MRIESVNDSVRNERLEHARRGSAALCRANRRVVEILVGGPELRRAVRKIVWIQDGEGLDPRHWCLLIPARRTGSPTIVQSDA
jgi:hypothetical protein